MRTLMFEGPGALHWREVPDARVEHGRDVVVRPLAVARCDLDPAIALGLYPMAGPFPMGHEMVGEVVDRGDSAGDWQPGDRVVVPFQISCGECVPCRIGRTNACAAVPPGASFGLGPAGAHHGSALSDLVRVPFADFSLLPLPDGLDPVAACGIPDNVADGYRCVAGPLADRPGEAVLVVGGLAASVGLYAVMAARALGSGHVVYVDDDPARLDRADELGADARAVVGGDWVAAVGRERFAITVDANVLDPGRTLAITATAPCGTCTSVSGGAGRTVELPLGVMYAKGITYEVGRVHARATAPAVLDLVTRGHLDPAAIIDAVIPFDDAPGAMVDPRTKIVFLA